MPMSSNTDLGTKGEEGRLAINSCFGKVFLWVASVYPMDFN